ncbi:MAG: saccharopine dehydrogenase NADP-binding domain-containing protein, partial [Terracidiphilus sp.]
VQVGSTVDELAKLFSGAKVVCNTVGPFIYYGPTVMEACFKAGCHYVDISGEQAWNRQVVEQWGDKFAAKGLLVAPATAFM